MKFSEKMGVAIRLAILTWSSLTAISALAQLGAEEVTLAYATDGLNTVPGADQVPSTKGRVRFEGVGRKGGLLCIGSSYAWHAPSPEKLKWNGDWGMAASSREKDVVHRIWRELRRHHPDAPLCIAQSAEWERHYDEDETLLEREYGGTQWGQTLPSACKHGV